MIIRIEGFRICAGDESRFWAHSVNPRDLWSRFEPEGEITYRFSIGLFFWCVNFTILRDL